MEIEGLNPQPLSQSGQNTPGRAREEGKLKDACQQFEQMYLQQMLGEMRKCSGKKEGQEGGGQQQDMFQGMLDQERAKAWSQEGGIGLANLLFQQMKQTM